MFNEDQLKLLMEFYHHCHEFIPKVEESSADWCQSYYQYEVLQGLILGDDYAEGFLPLWLRDRPKYRGGPILRHIKAKKDTFETLKNIKSLSDYLVVCEVGYGTDLIVAIMVKDWAEIRCYDHNPYMEEGLINFFVKERGVNLTFEQSPSSIFDFVGIDKRTIVVANHSHIPVTKQGKNIRDNGNIIYVSGGAILDKIPVTVEECREYTGRGYL